jgi:glycosyltransferase involved in cell wall biosynthesis
METPLISFVIPVGKMSGLLKNLEQTLNFCTSKKVEIIVVHDHFDNETCDELSDLISNHSQRITITKLDTSIRGVGNARNLGICHATGKWIGFLDSDDIANIDLYIEMVQNSEKEHRPICIGQYLESKLDSPVSKDDFEPKYKNGQSLIEISKSPGLWRWVFLRQRVEGVAFLNLTMAEDLLFLKMVDPIETEISFFPKIIYNYISGTPGQLTKDKSALRSLSLSFSTAIKLDKEYKFQGDFSRTVTRRIGYSLIKRNPSIYVVINLLFLMIRSIKPRRIFNG